MSIHSKDMAIKQKKATQDHNQSEDEGGWLWEIVLKFFRWWSWILPVLFLWSYVTPPRICEKEIPPANIVEEWVRTACNVVPGFALPPSIGTLLLVGLGIWLASWINKKRSN